MANDELEDVKWDVSDNAVHPDESSPSPSNTVDSCKIPVSVYGNYSSQLPQHTEFKKLCKYQGSGVKFLSIQLKLTNWAIKKALRSI